MAHYLLDSIRKAPKIDPFADVKRRAVTFSLYGCLVNYRLIPHFVGQLAVEHGLKSALAESYFNVYYNRVMYGERFRAYKDLLLRTLQYVDMEMDSKGIFANSLDELYLMHADLRPTPDVVDGLSDLKKKNVELYMLANTDKNLARHAFGFLGDFFDEAHILTVDDTHCYKPDAAFFQAANDKFKLRSADHFHVASNYFTDIVPAKQLHWDTIYVNRRRTGIMEDAAPEMMISSFIELEDAMVTARIRQMEEEAAAQQREAEAAAKAEEEARAAAEAAAATRAAREAALQQQRQAQRNAPQRDIFGDEIGGRSYDSSVDAIGAFSGFTPLNMNNPQDAKIAAKLKGMSPARARAIAAARERALAYSKTRGV